MKQSIGAGPGPPDENMAQQKIEATAENNATSNHSSGYMACIQRNRECIEKGTDAQVFLISYTFCFSLGVDASLDSLNSK